MLQSLRRFLIRLLNPINKFLGDLHYAPRYRDLSAKDIWEISKSLKPGDVLISYSSGELTNLLIDGEYKHAAMFTGKGFVVEAVGTGVRRVNFYDFARGKDKIAALRSTFCTEDQAIIAAVTADGLVGKPYDYDFEPNEKAFYCAEIISYCYDLAKETKSPFKTREIMGVMTVLPIDFKNASDKFSIVIERPAK